MAIATVGATEAVRPGHRLLSAHGVAHVAVEAVVRKSDPALIAVAVGAGRDEVSPAERPSGLIVIEARQPPSIRAMASIAGERVLPGVRIDVAGAASRRRWPLASDAVTLLAVERLVAALQREAGLAVIEAAARIGELGVGGKVAGLAFGADVLSVAGRVAGGAGDGGRARSQILLAGSSVALFAS